jgi:hypothetical protein
VLGEDAVFGVEAGPETARLARRNLAANGFEGVKVLKGAVVGAGAGEVEFGQLPARPIAALLAKFHPTVICCDIEGAELEVLVEPLPGVRLVVVETHPQVYGPDGVERIRAALVAQGFEVEPRGAKKDTLVFRRD